MNQYDFKGVWIPREIWHSKTLAPNERILFAEIFHLDKKLGCFASNARFAKFLGVSDRQVRNYIAKLKKLGFVKVTYEDIDFKGRLLEGMRVIRCTGRYERFSEKDLIQFTDEELSALSDEELAEITGAKLVDGRLPKLSDHQFKELTAMRKSLGNNLGIRRTRKDS